jgi:hypothetical protein
MSLYFSVAVWASLLLGGFGLIRHLVPRYRVPATATKARWGPPSPCRDPLFPLISPQSLNAIGRKPTLRQ